MYAESFGLCELPFNNTPDPRFFYTTPEHEEALASMIYAIGERKGFMLLTGEVGSGKTLLAKMAMQHFGNHVCAASINQTVWSARDLLAAVCNEFGVPLAEDAGVAAHIRTLHDFLRAEYAHRTPAVLLIDEAQALPPEGFEQLRMLGNLEDENAKLLQALIVGQPELRARMQAPAMRQLRQRIFRSFHLPALTRQHCAGYIRHRLTIAGAERQDLFEDDAIDAIYRYSQGLPRLINTLCDNALLCAYSMDTRTVDAGRVESVISQMLTIEHRTPHTDMPPGMPLRPPSGLATRGPADETAPAAPTPAPPAPAPVGVTPEQLREVLESVSRTDRRTTEDKFNDIVRRTDDKLTAALRCTEEKVQHDLDKTETRLVDAVRDTHHRLLGVSRRAEDLWRRLPRLTASTVRRDQQLGRLTSIVARLIHEVKQQKERPERSGAPPGPAPRGVEAAPDDQPACQLPSAANPLSDVSTRLSALVHRTNASMGELRSLIDEVRRPARAQRSTLATDNVPDLGSPVHDLASEVRTLAAMMDELEHTPPV